MKRFLLLFTFVAALLTTGCSKPEPQKFENGITATFNVTLPGEIDTKAISDGNQATELLFRVFDSENRLLSDLNQSVQVSGKRATVTAKLVRGVKYQFVFWAQKPGQFTISDANLTIPANKLSTMHRQRPLRIPPGRYPLPGARLHPVGDSVHRHDPPVPSG